MFTIEGFGSGFVLDSASGPLVVTAHHVVRGATEVVVIDHLGRRWQANRVAALDEEADIAVLRVPDLPSELTPLRQGKVPKIGESVVLVSSPLGLRSTVAFGSVAAERPTAKAFQLAAGVSPGSSGGLVANMDGHAVGVIRSKASRQSGGENIALAAPMSFVREALEDGELQRLARRPDKSKMRTLERRNLETRPNDLFVHYPAAAGVRVKAGKRPIEHLCASSGPGTYVAVREVGSDFSRWRSGKHSACATVLAGQELEVWVGTRKATKKVLLRIAQQR